MRSLNLCLSLPALFPFILPASSLLADDNPRISHPLIIRQYPSITAGIDNRTAVAATRPAVDLFAGRLGVKIDFNFEIVREQDSVKALYEFGRKLDRGEIHLGAVWGLEYGWLRSRYRRLRPLVVASQSTPGGKNDLSAGGYPSQIMVAPDRPKDLANFKSLKEKSIASFKRSPMMDRIFLERLCRDQGFSAKDYFKVIRDDFETPQEAIAAVLRGDVDAMVVDTVRFGRHLSEHAGAKLVAIEQSKPFPEPVLIGNPEEVNSIQPGLWEDLQTEFLALGDTRQGRLLTRFWMFSSFASPGKQFDDLLSERLRDYSLDYYRQTQPLMRR